jgi:hypothetical protein
VKDVKALLTTSSAHVCDLVAEGTAVGFAGADGEEDERLACPPDGDTAGT